MRLAVVLALFLFSQVSVGQSPVISKIVNGKIGKTAMAILGTGIITCSTLLGCGDQRGRVLVEDVIREDASYDGRYAEFVDFEIEGNLYTIYIEETNTGELLIEYDDEYGRLVFLQQSIGEFIPDHPDIGRDAYFISVVDGRDVYLDGVVTKVTDNGYYVVEVYQYTDMDTGVETRYVPPYERLVNIALLSEDGGVTLE